jgi:hypothetical protein
MLAGHRQFGSLGLTPDEHRKESFRNVGWTMDYTKEVIGCTMASFRKLLSAERTFAVATEHMGMAPGDVNLALQVSSTGKALESARNMFVMCLRSQGFAGLRLRKPRKRRR